MNSSRDGSEDKVVVDPVELEGNGQPRAHKAAARGDEPMIVRAKGTREQPPVTRDPEPLGAPPRGTRDFARDPVEVLRMWPHSTGNLADHVTRSRATLPAPTASRCFDDKIVLAHLALDLYRELEDVQAAVRGALPVQRKPAPTCDNQRCQGRTSALRGALVEACLMIQRVALMPSTVRTKEEVDDCLRNLLELVEH